MHAVRGKREGEVRSLFIQGKSLSLAPVTREPNQLPKPPNIIGSTRMKIITNARAVTITL